MSFLGKTYTMGKLNIAKKLTPTALSHKFHVLEERACQHGSEDVPVLGRAGGRSEKAMETSAKDQPLATDDVTYH